jgi:hypothetical protein
VSTGYGQTLIVKTGLFLLAGAVGLGTTLALRSSRVPHRLGASWAWMPRLELAVLVAALLPAALLTASAPARENAVRAVESAPVVVAAPKTFATVGDLILSVAVEPNRPGPNFVTVGVIGTRRPAPAPIRAVNLSLSGPDSASRSMTLASIGSDQWQGVTDLPSGRVRIGVTVRRPGLPTATATTVRAVSAGLPLVASAVHASEGGIMQRPLEPILRPDAIGAALLLLLVILAAVSLRERTVSSQQSRRLTPQPPGELQPRRVGR